MYIFRPTFENFKNSGCFFRKWETTQTIRHKWILFRGWNFYFTSFIPNFSFAYGSLDQEGVARWRKIRSSDDERWSDPDEASGDKDFRSRSISREPCDSTIHVFVRVCCVCLFVCVQRVYVHERVIMYSRSAPWSTWWGETGRPARYRYSVTDVNYPFCIAGEKRSSRSAARTYRVPIVYAVHPPRARRRGDIFSRLRLARSRQSEGALDFDRPYCWLFAQIFQLKSVDPRQK